MQNLADLLGINVITNYEKELTSVGCAFVAGLGRGIF